MVDQEIDDEIASANPFSVDDVRGTVSPETRKALFEDITASELAMPAATVSPMRRRVRRRVYKSVAAAAAVLMLSAAAWGTFAARTGLFGEEGSEEGSGELIRLDAPDAGPIIDELGQDIPLPPEATFESWKRRNLKASEGAGVLMTESGIRSTLSYVASCEWTAYWLKGYERGDQGIMRRAQVMLDEIPSWEALVRSDPGGGTVAAMKRRATGARQKDPSVFMDEYKINCTNDHPPIAD